MEATPLSSAGCRAAVWRWITYPPRFRERVAPIIMKLKMMTGFTFLVVEKEGSRMPRHDFEILLSKVGTYEHSSSHLLAWSTLASKPERMTQYHRISLFSDLDTPQHSR